MSEYGALVVSADGDRIDVRWRTLPERALEPGEVRVAIEYSDLNYKDGLAVTGRPGVVRRHPLVAGIDLVGEVVESTDAAWAPGDRVTVNGHGLSETHDGGFAEQAVVPGSWLTRIPDTISDWEAAAIGTAGFTAALAVNRLLAAALPDGEVVVTGASGGAGSLAVQLGAAVLDRPVVAVTGRPGHAEWLGSLGAASVIDRTELDRDAKPLESERWAGGIDAVGGRMLATVLAQTRWGGTVAAYGMAGGVALPATVMPFILRDVTLAGINSVFARPADREAAWSLLATSLDRDALSELTDTIGIGDVVEVGGQVLAGAVRGRTVVRIG